MKWKVSYPGKGIATVEASTRWGAAKKASPILRVDEYNLFYNGSIHRVSKTNNGGRPRTRKSEYNW